MVNNDYFRRENETANEYEQRCYRQKNTYDDITWQNLTCIMNDELRQSYSESFYRKRSYAVSKENKNEVNENTLNTFENLISEIKKEKVKLTDERVQNNAFIRRLAREDTLKEIAREYAEVMCSKKILVRNPIVFDKDSTKIGTLMLSDWHYGLEVQNYFNEFNEEIFLNRIYKLKKEVTDIIKRNKIKDLHIVNLSDLIAGRIHLSIRLQSRYDVISQTMFVSEVLAELLNYFSGFCTVFYHDVLDNHSRLEPNKNDSLDLESLARIIPWYLKQRLIDNQDIIFEKGQQANDIVAFKIFDFNVAAVHGHKDKPHKVINNMTNMLGYKNDLVLTAHFHHFAAEEENNCIRISNGCLIGVDDYSESLRLVSKPSQTFIISTPDNVCKEIHRIELS